MKDCSSIQECFLDAFDDALPYTAKARLLEHLQLCAICRAEYHSLARLHADLKTLGEARYVRHAVHLTPSVMNALAEHLRRQTLPEDEITAEWVEHSEVLARLEHDLVKVGEAWRDTVPRVDLRPALMSLIGRAAESKAESDPDTSRDGDFAADENEPGFVELEQDLLSLGEAYRRSAHVIDITDGVVSRIPRRSPTRKKKGVVVPFPQERVRPTSAGKEQRRRNRWFSTLMGMAGVVAAMLVGVLAYVQWLRPQETSFQVAQEQFRAAAPPRVDLGTTGMRSDATEGEPTVSPSESGPSEATSLTEESAPPSDVPSHTDTSSSVRLAKQDVPLADVIEARKKMLTSEEAAAKLARWASLTPEEARALLRRPNLPVDVIMGAAQFLPPLEAASYLRQAARLNPNMPEVHYALAKALLDAGEYGGAAREIAELRRLDPTNGLADYLEATLYSQRGDWANAIDRLASAAEADLLTPYTLSFANYRASTLAAAGMNSSSAQALAAFTAGSREFDAFSQTASALRDQAAAFQAQGDYESAQALLMALAQLGFVITDSASFLNEQVAGLNAAQAALEALTQLFELFPTDELAVSLRQLTRTLVTGLEQLNAALSAFDNTLQGLDLNATNDIVSQILQGGDRPPASSQPAP